MTADVDVAAPTPGDVTALFALARAMFAGLPGWSDERVLATLDSDVVFVARERGQPAGYVALHADDQLGALVVDQIFVAPGHERRGVGRRLLAYAEGYAIARRADVLRIVAEETNERARSFYRREGFVPVGPELLERVLPRIP